MIGSSFEYPIFFNKNFSQATSHATSAKDLYFTYVVDNGDYWLQFATRLGLLQT
jgi:hypothetical protein